MEHNVAVSIAIALRTAFARAIGVEVREIGWAVQLNSEDNVFYRDIYLFDAAGGGAGYVADAGAMLRTVLHEAMQILDCTCGSACHACLLDFDTQNHFEFLDQKSALAWFGNDYLSYFEVPREYRCYGERTLYEGRNVTECLLERLANPGILQLEIVVGGEPTQWDSAEWTLWRHLASHSLADHGLAIRLLVPASLQHRLSWHAQHDLLVKAMGREIGIVIVSDVLLRRESGYLAARLIAAKETTEWAVFDSANLSLSSDWGGSGAVKPIVRAVLPQSQATLGTVLQLADLEAHRPSHCVHRMIQGEWDGPITSLGDRFWKTISVMAPALERTLQTNRPSQIEYSDRYVRSPFAAKLLYEILRPFSSTVEAQSISLAIDTLASNQAQVSRLIEHDWTEMRTQERVLQGLFSPGFSVTVKIAARARNLPHARILKLLWLNGESIEIHLDQGMGFAGLRDTTPFDFQLAPAKQVNVIAGLKKQVVQGIPAMPIYVIKPSLAKHSE